MIDPCDRLRFTTRLFPHHDTYCMGIRNTFIDPQWHNNNSVFLAVKNRMPFRGQTTEVPQMTSPLHLYPQYGNTTQWSTQTLQHNWKTGKWLLQWLFICSGVGVVYGPESFTMYTHRDKLAFSNAARVTRCLDFPVMPRHRKFVVKVSPYEIDNYVYCIKLAWLLWRFAFDAVIASKGFATKY